MERKTCLITGATGFIGSHLARALVDAGAEVHAIVRPSSSLERIADVSDRMVLHRADLDDRAAIAACMRAAAPEQVFHLAAETRRNAGTNFASARRSILEYQIRLLNLVEALAQAPVPPAVLVRAGTLAEYGSSPTPSAEHQREAPGSPYAAGIAAGTHYLGMLADLLPFPVVTARLALVYGPRQAESFFIPAAIRACLEGREVVVDRPDDRRDLVHVADVVDALQRLAAAAPPGATILNVASGEAPRTAELAIMIAEETRCDPSLIRHCTARPGSTARELLCATAQMNALTGWRPTTPLREGLAATVRAIRTSLPVRAGATS